MSRWGDSTAVHEYKVYQGLLKKCGECSRVFDLTKDVDAAEWVYGHDCED